jgi:5-methylcytosine-specific restriction protein B
MSLEKLIDIIQLSKTDDWNRCNKEALAALFGSPLGRYRNDAKNDFALRAPEQNSDSGVKFAAYIHPSNPTSGRYHGLSFVVFPVEGQPSLTGLVVGTDGLSPDEAILGRPGHARKTRAICDWLNTMFGNGRIVAWAKQDPTRNDLAIPDNIRAEWPEYKKVFDRYGKEVYALYRPSNDRKATESAVAAFLDLMFQERGHEPLAPLQAHAESIRSGWFEHLMPGVERATVRQLLEQRRYVIIQGPPGTGKTKMALDLLQTEYGGFGQTIQFHPNTTYEGFIGGLAPVKSSSDLGLRFEPAPGSLMQAAKEALCQPERPYLLHIDEINRADLGKILGEAIFLLESSSEVQRRVSLSNDFGDPFHSTFFLPANLHILGTMNSADRSIALVDVAVRRRFAFVSLWPRMAVIDQYGCALMKEAFQRLLSIFVEHASDDAFSLIPGHSYFLEKDDERAKQSLKVNLAPLLDEYLAQGYVSGFAEPVRSYLQWLRVL